MKYDNLKEITFLENCKGKEIDILKGQASTRSSYDVVLADKAKCLQLRFLQIWGSKSMYGSKYSKNVGPCSAVSRHGTAAVRFCGLLKYGENRMHEVSEYKIRERDSLTSWVTCLTVSE